MVCSALAHPGIVPDLIRPAGRLPSPWRGAWRGVAWRGAWRGRTLHPIAWRGTPSPWLSPWPCTLPHLPSHLDLATRSPHPCYRLPWQPIRGRGRGPGRVGAGLGGNPLDVFQFWLDPQRVTGFGAPALRAEFFSPCGRPSGRIFLLTRRPRARRVRSGAAKSGRKAEGEQVDMTMAREFQIARVLPTAMMVCPPRPCAEVCPARRECANLGCPFHASAGAISESWD